MSRSERKQKSQIKDDTSSSGSSNSASINLGIFRKDVDVFYDVSTTSDDIVCEISTTGDFSGEQRTHTRLKQADGEVSTGGDIFQINTVYQYIRVYAGGSFADSDVNVVEIVSRGE